MVESEVINLGNALYTETWFNGRLDTDDDEDWVHLVVNPDEMISVRCYDQDLGSQADLRVEVLTSTGEDITPWGQGSTAIPDGDYYLWDADSTAGGDFYLRILRESGPSGPSAYYRCLATAADFSFQ